MSTKLVSHFLYPNPITSSWPFTFCWVRCLWFDRRMFTSHYQGCLGTTCFLCPHLFVPSSWLLHFSKLQDPFYNCIHNLHLSGYFLAFFPVHFHLLVQSFGPKVPQEVLLQALRSPKQFPAIWTIDFFILFFFYQSNWTKSELFFLFFLLDSKLKLYELMEQFKKSSSDTHSWPDWELNNMAAGCLWDKTGLRCTDDMDPVQPIHVYS